jgi:uncharacterized protein YidB (DUF937 family)
MGLLDDVIGAALGSKSASGSGLSSPIAMALMALLASKMAPGSTGQSPLGGLGGLLDQFRQNGLEQVIKSWVGTGPNQAISSNQLHQALGPEVVDDLAEQTGMSHDDLLTQLSRILPGVVDNLTPHGKLPSESDLLPGPR